MQVRKLWTAFLIFAGVGVVNAGSTESAAADIVHRRKADRRVAGIETV